jgi:hypothetical protein
VPVQSWQLFYRLHHSPCFEAEYFIAPAQGIIPLNNEIDDETAAQLIGMPISAPIRCPTCTCSTPSPNASTIPTASLPPIAGKVGLYFRAGGYAKA